jgi:hypothetical protein
MRILILSCFLTAWAVSAGAAPVLRSQALPFFENGQRSFVNQSALGSVCSVMRSFATEPACNPALLGEDSETDSNGTPGVLLKGHSFGVNLFFGDEANTLYKNRSLISGGKQAELAQAILSDTRPVRFEASAMLWWRSEKMALSYQPTRVTYFSAVRNPAYPDIAIQAMQEQSVQWQTGGFVTDTWRIGVQLRYLERKFVYEEFTLFDALPHIEDYFKVRDQKAFFVEPAIAYEFNQSQELKDWRPLLTTHLTQAGWTDHSFDDVPVEPLLDSGFSISPPIRYGTWELGLNYHWTTRVSAERKFRFGTLYRWSFAEVDLAYDQDQWSLGFLARMKMISFGGMYRKTTEQDATFAELRFTL